MCVDELEDFPLDAGDGENNEPPATGLAEESNAGPDGENADANERIDLGGLMSPANKVALFNKIMLVAMKKPGSKQRIAQVLPIIRAMSPSQRLTLATLVLNQIMAKKVQPSVESAAGDVSDNTTSELMIPISADIASIFHGLGKDAGSGRSTGFGTYYYNPLSAGYRVGGPQPQRPPLYNIRRFQFPNSRRKDDVPPEMMPPPYSPPVNVSYNNFNKQTGASDFEGEDNDEDNEEEDENENTDDNEKHSTNTEATKSKECVPFINNLCLDVNSYPSKDIINSIRSLEQKNVFRALVEDSVNNVTTDSPEIERRYGNEEDSNLQICASKVKYAKPKKAKSLNGSWKFVVNTEHYTQTVRIETCLNPDKSCSHLNENVKSRCTQIYNYHRLLTWDEKNGLSLDLFKIPTCCSCQIQHIAPFVNTKKYPQKPDVGLQENVIADEPTVFHPAISKPTKPKTKSTAPYSPKRDSFHRPRRPPPILPLNRDENNYQHPPTRYSPNDNAIRRTSLKNNPLKGVYVPGKGTFIENPEVEGTTPSHRVNYNYHPIIDFFRSTPKQLIDRADTIDDWLPMTEGPRAMPK